jgi:two-component system, cell cycle sensor histidine kinase and response regulator CckA
VLLAENGLDALEVYKARGSEIDLVLLDLTMPRMNGEEAFKELTRLNPAVRVVMSSGYTESEINARLGGKGLAGFVQKPYTVAALRDCLRPLFAGDAASS